MQKYTFDATPAVLWIAPTSWDLKEEWCGASREQRVESVSYTRTAIHEATKAELERVKKSHAELWSWVRWVSVNRPDVFIPSQLDKIKQTIANAEKALAVSDD